MTPSMHTLDTLLGFDYGGKRIGVAVGQTLTGTARPLTSVRVKNAVPDWEAIARLIRTWEPDALVVGWPLNMDGTEQASTQAARHFQQQLQNRFHIPVHTADERLSTREAKARLASRGTPEADDDPVAAQIILETWFSVHGSPECLI